MNTNTPTPPEHLEDFGGPQETVASLRGQLFASIAEVRELRREVTSVRKVVEVLNHQAVRDEEAFKLRLRWQKILRRCLSQQKEMELLGYLRSYLDASTDSDLIASLEHDLFTRGQ